MVLGAVASLVTAVGGAIAAVVTALRVAARERQQAAAKAMEDTRQDEQLAALRAELEQLRGRP
jgi:formiminotetrahydrofolate cyclodeaminase